MPPLRVERFNDNGRHPNKLISFIKQDPKTSPQEQKRALDVLNRVAAIVYPIMKDNGLQVTSLEEHAYNDKWAGMNWNAGECIQLVLRTANGGWTPEPFVLSVMLHELSHCTNMHHARSFWQTLGLYRTHMSQLQGKGYTGEGFWGRGRQLGTGIMDSNASVNASELPRAICGGASRGQRFTRKRRRKATSTSKTLKPGAKLGGDLELRKRLDGGKSKATPRVVKSKRGKELRATAAELRFSAQLTDQFKVEEKQEGDIDSASESEETEEVKPTWKYEDEEEDIQGLLNDEMKMLQESAGPRRPATVVGDAVLLENKEPEVIDILSDTTDDERNIQFTRDEVQIPRQIDGEELIENGVECPVCTLQSPLGTIQCDACETLLKVD